MVEELNIEFVRALYPFTGGDHAAVPLLFAESTILQVVEKTQEGWCRGFAAGKEGWFPISYVKPLGNGELLQKGIQPASLAALMHCDLWSAHITGENKIYYVNTENKGTTWELPSAPAPVSPTTGIPNNNPDPLQAAVTKQPTAPKLKTQKSKKLKQIMVNGITFEENGEEQPLLEPAAVSYVDHFWADKGDQSGFDVILVKHVNGKECMKDMIDFFRERAALEEQYAKGLQKLSKSTLGDQEEGTLGKAWQSLKAECRHRSDSHLKFVDKLQKDMEKPLFEYKESQKKARKEHQQVMEKSRKQVTSVDAAIEKAFGVPASKGKTKRGSSGDLAQLKKKGNLSGEEIKKLQESYNVAQRQWRDNMISACQDFQRHEGERSDYLQRHLLNYVDICVAVDEDSAESLSRVADAIDRINAKADREYFIKLNGTGIKRPVDRTFDQ